ncbi:ANTAR domain-containing protein [Mycobacterium sp. UM_WGJ]|uniref:ANTAR domain-containing protein n=1 Tax=Mycobacterium sp. UM_WGJ TaxID=1370120 RepID=UPI00042115BE|nr:ANTAR domain-containing protein [Mycobacterium sp. UM_WGJ]
MDITAALAADLAALTEILDAPDFDLTDTLRQLAGNTKLAVGSYLGLTVMITAFGRQSTFTVLESGTELGDIVTSMRLPMPPAVSDPIAGPLAVLILYAGNPGAFVDLAADLAWLTGLALSEFVLDQHRIPPRPAPGGLAAASLIDQAIGVLIARGYTLEHAHRELDARAQRLGVGRIGSANDILDELNQPVSEDD